MKREIKQQKLRKVKESSDPTTKPIINTTVESGEDGQIPRQISNTKIKSGSNR